MSNKQKGGTVDLTPTWEGILPALVLVITETKSKEESVTHAVQELRRMARVADKAVKVLKAMEAIQAIVHGEYDNKELLKYGSLSPVMVDNILHVLRTNELID